MAQHPGCSKTEIYAHLSKSCLIPEKLSEMKDMRLISMSSGSVKTSEIYVTSKGLDVLQLLVAVQSVIRANDSEREAVP